MKVNDTITLSNQHFLYSAFILALNPTQVTCKVTAVLPSSEPQLKITLYQGIPKGEKMDYLLQKGTEAGISAFVPVAMERSIVKIHGKDEEKKLNRWNKITLEAAKQSKRVLTPLVSPPILFSQLIEKTPNHDLFLIPWEESHSLNVNLIHQNFPKLKNIGILIGPEGGISQKEILLLTQNHAYPLTLGKRIFRTETAGLAATIALFALYGDLY